MPVYIIHSWHTYDGSVFSLHLWDVFIQEQQGGIRLQNNQIKTKIDQGAK